MVLCYTYNLKPGQDSGKIALRKALFDYDYEFGGLGDPEFGNV